MAYGNPVDLSDVLNKQLSFLNNNSFTDHSNLFAEVIEQNAAATTTKIGVNLEDDYSGIVPLTQQVDDIVPGLDRSSVTQINGQYSITEITDVPELKNKIKPNINSTAKSDLQLITGSNTAASEQALNVVIASGAPEAIGAALKQTASANKGQLSSVLGRIIDTSSSLNLDLQSGLNKVTDGLFDAKLSLFSVKNSTFGKVFSDVGRITQQLNTGLNGIINNVFEARTLNIQSQILPLLVSNSQPINISPAQMSEIIRQLDAKDVSGAMRTLLQYGSTVSPSLIQTALNSIDTSLVNQVQTPQQSLISPKSIRSRTDQSSDAYPFVSTEEELIVELKSIQREVTELIVTWTQTRLDQNLSSGDLNNIFTQLGKTIPYHYVIKRDGSLQRGRNIEQKTDSLNNRHEQYSILVAFVGGVNLNVSSRTQDEFYSSQSLTSEQMKTFNTIVRLAYDAYPGIQVLGLNDIDRGQDAPGFDVILYTESKFGKSTIYDDPSSQQPYNAAVLRNIKAEYSEEI